MSSSLHDSAQGFAEAEVEKHRRQLGPFVVAAEDTRMPMVFTNAREAGHPLIFANDSFLKLTGYTRQEVLGKSLAGFLAPHNAESARIDFDRSFAGEDIDAEFACLTRDNREIWVSLHVSPVHAKDGTLTEHFASVFDLTRHKNEQRRARVLIDELNHRVKNNMATLQSIVRLASKRLGSEGNFAKAVEERILALAQAHDMLEKSHWGPTPVRRVIEAALGPENASLARGAGGPDPLLSAGQSFSLSVVIHELLIASHAYGELGPSGSVEVGLKVIDGSRCVLSWSTRGDRPAGLPDLNLCALMIKRRVEHELYGQVHFVRNDTGFECSVDFPLGANTHE